MSWLGGSSSKLQTWSCRFGRTVNMPWIDPADPVRSWRLEAADLELWVWKNCEHPRTGLVVPVRSRRAGAADLGLDTRRSCEHDPREISSNCRLSEDPRRSCRNGAADLELWVWKNCEHESMNWLGASSSKLQPWSCRLGAGDLEEL